MSPKIRKKDPCPCGSGKKYKDCCFKVKKYSNITISTRKQKEKIKKEERKRERLIKGAPMIKKEPPMSQLAVMRFRQKLKGDPATLEKLGKEIEVVDPEKGFKDFILKSWDNKELAAMDTEEILKTLESLNITFDKEQFKIQAKNYISAIKLAEDHYYTQDFTAEGRDEDFIWLAIVELWKRLIPEQCNVEMIDDAIQDGYDLLKRRNYTDGLQKWEAAWHLIKTFVPLTITSAEEADQFMPVPLTEPFFNWCQDFEIELYNRGLEDKSWLEKRITYVNEFCQRFPHTESLIIQTMLQAEAQSYALLGDMEKAESLFETLVKKFSDSVWAYIAWGDIYWTSKDVPDYEKAEHIYRLALDHCTADISEIYERLESIEEEKKR